VKERGRLEAAIWEITIKDIDPAVQGEELFRHFARVRVRVRVM